MSETTSTRVKVINEILPTYAESVSANNTPFDINAAFYNAYLVNAESNSSQTRSLLNLTKFESPNTPTRRTWVSREETVSETNANVHILAHLQLDLPKIDEIICSEDIETDIVKFTYNADQARLQLISDRIRKINAAGAWEKFLSSLLGCAEMSNHDDVIAFLSDSFNQGKASERAAIAATLGKIGSGPAVSLLRNARMKEGNRFVLSVINAYLDNQRPR